MSKLNFLALAACCAFALFPISCLVTDEPKAKEVCIVNGVQRDCDELRRINEELNKPIDTAAQSKARRADSLARLQDSLDFIRLKAGTVYRIQPKPAGEFVEIPAGTYQRVDGKTLSIKSFHLSNVELTRARYAEMTGAAPVATASANNPAPVSWYEALRACNTWSRLQGLDSVFTLSAYDGTRLPVDSIKVDFRKNGYRLTTEAEWEYAAKGGTTTRNYWGDATLDSLARHYAWTRFRSGLDKPVALLIPNPFGLFDMIGNAWEYTLESRARVMYLKSDIDTVPYPDPAMEYHISSLIGSACVVKGGGVDFQTDPVVGADFRIMVSKTSNTPVFTARLARTKVADGLVIDTYPDGRKRSQREYKNGAIFGTRTTWLDSGYRLEEYFDGGKKGERLYDSAGLFIVYSEDGMGRYRISYKATGKDSVKHGPYMSWYPGGSRSVRETGFYTDGIQDGLFLYYWDNGKLSQERPYLKGALNGTFKSYNENGIITHETPMVNGMPEGLAIEWVVHFNLNIAVHGTETLHENGIANPKVTLYHDSEAKVTSKSATREGLPGTQIMTYTPDGTIKSIYQRTVLGYSTPVFPEWYPSGALKVIHRVKPASNTVVYDVTFDEAGTCLSACANLAAPFKAEDYRRPADLEARFLKTGYVPFPADLTNILN